MGEQVRFQINDYVIYGSSGVCIVKDICVPDINIIDTTKKYYLLQPLYSEGCTIYSPVDNCKIVMRKILTKEETAELIRKIPSIEPFWIEDKKAREEHYRQTLNTCNCYELVRIIKSLHRRKKMLQQQNKPTSQVDERYLRTAEDLLYGELAVPLEIPKDQVESYILEQVEKEKAV